MENLPETTAKPQESAPAEGTAAATAATDAATAAIDAATRQALYQSAFLLPSRPVVNDSPTAAMQLVEELRPRSEDYARVFIGEYAERAQQIYAGLYLSPRPIERDPQQSMLRLFLATAAELRDKGPHALGFPGGYKDILEFLRPDSLWVHWKYTAPHSPSGMAYDGLTRIDDRWVWFASRRAKTVAIKQSYWPESSLSGAPTSSTTAPSVEISLMDCSDQLETKACSSQSIFCRLPMRVVEIRCSVPSM